ncbi:MAG: Arginine biosynthesis bifunctional protein ArgJ [Methanomicrobiales archaeon 53_19]|uniref:bifunctional ornithine acetyltransferase/N-acetylglutamate synthase n=1 Tax=Methanocalculus sp. TaxID=2004547 RepID=UPI000748266C|nr:bifunctional ornithine acetyltransferase/N-acetylglutamate synthase [Methanocalculus sp.]KUK69898.1 MAG: Arginine biosynthesis bifunctional protein ArgJ [Methanocalculus sp. 52_23]KUL03147.1 MAG: Arginine biosynthesis bifunctional protein ArgJ [Methanomicrobiales archaeon 53_19]HIJ07309.1 bifunctional ornithine acetyltransferase/N-acetylglutamate synthase [Methanocalculus sp.]
MKSICGVPGVTAAGIKEGKYGLALIKASGNSAAVFTQNKARAPVIDLMAERMKKNHIEGIIVNSGCANAFTGRQGMEDAIRMAEIGGEALGIDPMHVGVASTGVIGRYLNLDRIEEQAGSLTLSSSEEAEIQAARAIMTTDLVEKHALVRGSEFSVGGIAKGSGMIAPNMATMLGFLYTDAEIAELDLQQILKRAVSRSFNRIVVDGDVSTNDCVFLTATGEAGAFPVQEVEEQLTVACIHLAQAIARDGEGATKLIEVIVSGARNEEDASRVAKTVVTSPLVKTAVYGEDPNWGRVVAAAGYSGVDFEIPDLSLWIGRGEGKTPLVQKGEITADLSAAKAAMKGDTVVFSIDLDSGEGRATAWGCDLTEKYVEINGKYTT